MDNAALLIAVRFALYLDLMLIFGLPLFCLYTFRGAEQRTGREIVSPAGAVALSVAGAALAVIAVLLVAANMSDVPISQLSRETVDALLNQTATGTASKVRVAAMIATLPVIGFIRTNSRLRWTILSALGAIALGSLAWTGHGPADDGMQGTIHLTADIAHLLGAGVWVGALIGLLIRLLRARARHDEQRARIAIAHDALANFGTVGTFAVLLITLTGLVNSWSLVGMANISALPNSLYGRLLIMKLVLVAAMLGLAARNRFTLTPTIASGANAGSYEPSATIRPISRSVAVEASFALIVLGVVAWLGTLSPPSSAM
jgi:putative copper resistance protein D